MVFVTILSITGCSRPNDRIENESLPSEPLQTALHQPGPAVSGGQPGGGAGAPSSEAAPSSGGAVKLPSEHRASIAIGDAFFEGGAFFEDAGGNVSLVFEDAVSLPMPFTLFEAPCFEIWTLNMTLQRSAEHSGAGIEGRYEGQYRIDVEYDLSGFMSNLDTYVWNTTYLQLYGMSFLFFGEVGDQYRGFARQTVQNHGEYEASRRLEGVAEAFMFDGDGHCSIVAAQTSDVKDVDVRDITVLFHYAEAGSDSTTGNEFVFELSANGDNMNGRNTMARQSVVDYWDNEFLTIDIPLLSSVDTPWGSGMWGSDAVWGGYVWRRADNAGEGWSIEVNQKILGNS